MKRALNWMWNHADTIGIGCMWVGAPRHAAGLHVGYVCDRMPEPEPVRAEEG